MSITVKSHNCNISTSIVRYYTAMNTIIDERFPSRVVSRNTKIELPVSVTKSFCYIFLKKYIYHFQILEERQHLMNYISPHNIFF